MGLCTSKFTDSYLKSLRDYKSFYDDLAEYGKAATSRNVFYFIPGFNGVPGQIRFALPSFAKSFGTDFYIRGLYLDEFSACRPTWEKYTPENLEKRHARIIEDLEFLGTRYDELAIIVNSSGFYDLLAVYPEISVPLRRKLTLAWIACAPDSSEETPWEGVFYRLNGFTHGSDRWFAYPNHNLITFINRECSANKRWRYGQQKKTFFKYDLESRFYCAGILWAYVSVSRYNWVNQYNIAKAEYPIDIPAVVLVASKDGYWSGKSRGEIEWVIHRYLKPRRVLFRETSHLWVTVPENLSATLEALREIRVARNCDTQVNDRAELAGGG
ncbi:MAG: hypothetical protein ACU843_10815 [Gammaproteobacteria bacterium]